MTDANIRILIEIDSCALSITFFIQNFESLQNNETQYYFFSLTISAATLSIGSLHMLSEGHFTSLWRMFFSVSFNLFLLFYHVRLFELICACLHCVLYAICVIAANKCFFCFFLVRLQRHVPRRGQRAARRRPRQWRHDRRARRLGGRGGSILLDINILVKVLSLQR